MPRSSTFGHFSAALCWKKICENKNMPIKIDCHKNRAHNTSNSVQRSHAIGPTQRNNPLPMTAIRWRRAALFDATWKSFLFAPVYILWHAVSLRSGSCQSQDLLYCRIHCEKQWVVCSLIWLLLNDRSEPTPFAMRLSWSFFTSFE